MDNGENSGKKAVSPLNGQPVPQGRQKGVPNKATTRFKEALNELFEAAAPDMVQWLAEIPNPKDRFDVLGKFANYIYPQLARTDINHGGQDGNAVKFIIESAISGAPNSKESSNGKESDG
jgi:hypothetical protein